MHSLPHQPHRPTRIALRLVMGTFGRLVTVEGCDRLASMPDPMLFVLNHNNSVESVVVPSALIECRGGRLITFMIDWMFLHIPLVGYTMRLIDPIPVYTKPARFKIGESYRRARRHLSPVDAAVNRLARGDSVGVFPEGTRNPDPERLRAPRSGVGHLVLRSEAPVLPIGIEYPAARRIGRAPTIGRATIRVGEPIDFETERREVRRDRTDELDSRRFLELRRHVADTIMSALEPLSGKRYRRPDRAVTEVRDEAV
jgi:1-acyl-sn-glycerol-3-phosphate acyltransferase